MQIVSDVKNRGHIGRTILKLNDFGFSGLQVESLEATFDEVDYDWKKIRKNGQLQISKVGASRAQMTIPAASLETLLKARLQGVQNPRLALQDGLIRVSGTRAAPLVGTQVPFQFTAKPVGKGNEIRLENVQISLGGAPVPAMLANSLIGDFNPIYVFDRAGAWPFRVTLDHVAAQNGRLQLGAALVFTPPRP
ncbi:MAG TPA: DUF2993 domain-containing protein [Abditibacteriaceae bacterium]